MKGKRITTEEQIRLLRQAMLCLGVSRVRDAKKNARVVSVRHTVSNANERGIVEDVKGE
jgi:hypothetical protein